jgi:hypothetical protein
MLRKEVSEAPEIQTLLCHRLILGELTKQYHHFHFVVGLAFCRVRPTYK